MRGTKAVARAAGGYTLGLYVQRFTWLVRGFFIAKLLGPRGNGLWNLCLLLYEWGQYIHLGVLEGFSKDYPFQLGKNAEDEAEEQFRGGLLWVLLLGAIFWTVVLLVVLAKRGLEPELRAGFLIAAAVVVLEEVALFWNAFLRSHGRVGLVSRTLHLYSFVNLALSIALLFPFGLLGAIWAWVIARALSLVYLLRAAKRPVRVRVSPRVVKSLFVIGFPIFLLRASSILMRTGDRLVTARFLTTEDLGLYALAITISNLVLYLPLAVNFVVFPILLRRLGEHGRDPRSVERQVLEPARILAAAVPFLLGYLYFAVIPVLEWILPEYLGCLPALRLLVVAVFFGSLASLPVDFLIAIDKQRTAVFAGYTAVVATVGIGAWLASRGLGIRGVAMGRASGDTLHALFVLSYSFRFLRPGARAIAKTVVDLVIPGALVGACALLTVRLAGGSWARLALFAAFSLPVAAFVDRRLGILKLVRGMAGPEAA